MLFVFSLETAKSSKYSDVEEEDNVHKNPHGIPYNKLHICYEANLSNMMILGKYFTTALQWWHTVSKLPVCLIISSVSTLVGYRKFLYNCLYYV